MRLQTDQQVLDWVRQRVDEFVEHLGEVHGDDPRTGILMNKLKNVDLLVVETADGTWRSGRFKHSTGTLSVAPRDPKGQVRSEASLLKTVVHELAHATRIKEPGELSHSPQWKQTWLWFLGIATGHLKWRVDIKCAECTFYGLCDRAQCPKCTWLQNLCKPYVGSPSDAKLLQQQQRDRQRAPQPAGAAAAAPTQAPVPS